MCGMRIRQWAKASLAAATVLAGLMASVPAGAEDAPVKATPPQTGPRHVDLVLCLDTSNSMDGLIDSARQKLWAVVNELATAKPRPALRVALYQYGNDRLAPEGGWVQQVCDFTDDLDTVYEKLFALRTDGGSEFVARVMRAATLDLKWSAEPRALRVLVVAGNEPATQDPQYKLEEICQQASSRNIMVNAIFCGAESEGRQTGWADVARWTDGKYAAIDQDGGTVVIETPVDKKLAELSTAFNATYLPYGQAGTEGLARQEAQDVNAATASAPAAAERAAAKAGALYFNGRWDLVDASREKGFDLAKIADAELPEAMRKMTLDQRRAYLAECLKRRGEIQAEIAKLSAERAAFVRLETERRGIDSRTAFDVQLRSAIREQAEKQGFEFAK